MKKALAILLALAAIMCFGVFAASAEETTTEPVHTDHCYCVNAEFVPTDHACEETATWEDLSTATLADGGHYYLSKNLAKGLTVIDGMEITVCLNGHNLYAGCPITVNKGGVVNICNCKSEGRIYSSTRTKTAVVLVNSHADGYGIVNLYSGTISGAANSSAYIRCVDVNGGAFNMYGGTIVNGRSDGSNTNDSEYGNVGGNVIVRNHTSRIGTFDMYGGTITGGQANAYGGNIFVRGAVFTMNGGTITGGAVTGTPAETDTTLVGYGGNIFVTSLSGKSGTVTLNGGTVTGGTAYYGGNIVTNGENNAVKLTIDGATVSGGIANAEGGNIYILNSGRGTQFKLLSGSVTGGQATTNGGNISVSGSFVPTWTGGTVSNGTAGVFGGNIYLDVSSSANNFAGTAIFGGTATKNGGNIYVEAAGTTTVSTSTISGGSAAYGGNIYTKKTLIVGGGALSDGTATGSGGNIYSTASLTVTGGIISGGTAGETGGNVYNLGATEISITGGSITGGTATGHGGNLYLTHSEMVETKTLTISNVTISGGQSGNQGGNIYVAKVGAVTLTGVTLDGGNAATSGANIYMTANGSVTVTDSAFTMENTEKCSGSGGNIVISGNNCTFTNTTIAGGDATTGGAVALGQNGDATFEGCTIETAGGTTGKCFYIYKNATLTLKDCDVKNLSDGGTAIWNKGTVVLQGTVNMPAGNMDLMLDCREQEDACFDITGLTGQDDAYGIRRWQIDTIDDDLGVVAIGATDDTAAAFFAWADGYETAYNAEDGKIYMVIMAVHARNADGIVRGYYSLDEAMAETQEDLGINWYQLNVDLDGQTISKSIMLDLNGFNLTNTTVNEGVVVKLFDKANDTYDATLCGSLSGTVKGQIATVVHTSSDFGGSVKHYVILKDAEGVYTAHRFVAAITHRSLKPTEAALGFKATFSADEVARAAVVSYGYELWVDEGTAVVGSKEGPFEQAQILTLRLKNILSDNEANSQVGANGTIYGNTFIMFAVDAEGTQVYANGQTAPTKTTLKSFVEGVDAMIAADPAKLGETQMTALQNMINTFGKYMTGWATENIIAWTAPVEEPSEDTTV